MTIAVRNHEWPSAETLQHAPQNAYLPSEDELLPVASFDDWIKVDGERLDFTVHYPAGSSIGETAMRLLIGGYYGCKPLYEPLAERLAAHGETVATFSQRRHPGFGLLRTDNVLHPQRSLVEDTIALADHFYYEYRVEEYHPSGHSMGGQAAEGAAEFYLENPRPIRPVSVTSLQGAGHTPHNTLSLIAAGRKLGPELKQVIAKSRERDDHVVHEAVVYGAANIPFTLASGLQVSNCRGDRRLAHLRQNGIQIIAAYNEEDPLFPARSACRQIAGLVHQFIYGGDDHGGHFAPYLQPELTAAELSYSLQDLGFYSSPQPLFADSIS